MVYIYIYIWVNYNNSLTWIKAILGWFLLLTMIPGFGRSEVVMKFTQIYREFIIEVTTLDMEHPQFADHFRWTMIGFPKTLGCLIAKAKGRSHSPKMGFSKGINIYYIYYNIYIYIISNMANICGPTWILNVDPFSFWSNPTWWCHQNWGSFVIDGILIKDGTLTLIWQFQESSKSTAGTLWAGVNKNCATLKNLVTRTWCADRQLQWYWWSSVYPIFIKCLSDLY